MRRILTMLALASVSTTSSLHAQASDSVAVVRVAETLLRAISTKDTALARTTMVPGAVFFAVLDPAPANATAEKETDEGFYSTLATFPGSFLERMWAPQVKFSGTTLAQVAAPYDFHVNGKFSHCGTDVFTLVRTATGWRVASTAYTVQQANCRPSPLGPPKP